MNNKEPEYTLRLTWCGRKDAPQLQKVVEYLSTFPLFKDSEAKLVSYTEYTEMVKSGEVDEPRSYWKIGPEEVGLVSLKHFSSYTKTWDSINSAWSDFEAGWSACEKFNKINS